MRHTLALAALLALGGCGSAPEPAPETQCSPDDGIYEFSYRRLRGNCRLPASEVVDWSFSDYHPGGTVYVYDDCQQARLGPTDRCSFGMRLECAMDGGGTASTTLILRKENGVVWGELKRTVRRADDTIVCAGVYEVIADIISHL